MMNIQQLRTSEGRTRELINFDEIWYSSKLGPQ